MTVDQAAQLITLITAQNANIAHIQAISTYALGIMLFTILAIGLKR